MRVSRSLLPAWCAFLLLAAAHAQSWDIARDFSTSANPNGPWSFLFSTPQLGPTLCVQGAPPVLLGCTTGGWTQTVPAGNLAAGYGGVGINAGTTALTCTHNNGRVTTVPPGAVVTHVAQGTLIRWTAPAADTFRIRITLAPASPGTSTYVFIMHNTTQVFPNAGFFFSLPTAGYTWNMDFVASAPGDWLDLVLGFGTGNLTVESTNFLVDMRVAPAALWNTFGVACGPSYPWIAGDQRMVPGAASGVWLGGPSNTFGALAFSACAPGPSWPFGACTVYVAPGFGVAGLFVTDSSGTWFQPLQVPSTPTVVGAELTFQGAFASGATPSFWELTEGLHGRVGLWN